MFLIGFIFPYFCGISLNSRAGLEFKEFRLFSAIIEKKEIQYVFSKNHRGKSKTHYQDFLKKNFEFQHFCWKIIVEKESKFPKFKASPWI